MHVILPPSETKRTGGSGDFEPESLSHHSRLGPARAVVRDALEIVSASPEAAAKALKLGVKNADEALRNLELARSGVLPAMDRYAGVLYDALNATALEATQRAWLRAHVSIQSALFGLIGAGERVPAYRLSASSRLPALAGPLKRVWQDAHEGIVSALSPFVLDLRSKDYAALAPLPVGAGASLTVSQRGADGTVRALNHFNKAAKGDLVRRLARSRASIDSLAQLLDWASAEGLEMRSDDAESVELITDLGAPAAASRPAAAV